MSATHESPTAVEKFAWVAFGAAAAIYVVAGVFFLTEAAAYDGSPEAAAGWMTLAQGVAGAMLVPALLLTGARQLLPLLRDVLRGEKVADAEDR